MSNSKMRRAEPRDRLSELPDSIIFEIFRLLPMRDVVRTTVLSKLWENRWTTTPYLNFEGHTPEFVNRALIWWRGYRILKFKFGNDCGSLRNKSVVSDIDLWVYLAKKNGVEELYLEEINNNIFDRDATELYCVPHNLYSCSSLKVLSLRGCNLKIHGNVQLNQLRSLTIERCGIDGDWINQVVSGSPQLEVFILRLFVYCENVIIRSSSLKKLLIEKESCTDSDSEVPELRIWSPNLETLDISGLPFGKYSLMNVSSLTHITLDLDYEFNYNSFIRENLGQIFPSVQHVEKLTLWDWCIKGLRDMKEKNLVSPMSNFKSINMNKMWRATYEDILDILPIFPKLKTLVLRSDDYGCDLELEYSSFPQLERNLSESFLLQLRTVEITWSKDDDFIFPFIEILLKYASKLQMMSLRVEGNKPPSMPLFLALQQKLIRMPISSPTVDLVFPDYY